MSPFLAAIFLLGLCLANAINFTTVYEWDKLYDAIWAPGAGLSNGPITIPKNIEFRYMAVFGERLFLSLDWDDGIPATLVWLPTSSTSTASPKLAPFPTLNLHKKQNCDSIKSAKGIETDRDGRLWMLDNGSWGCPCKIWIFNLLKNDTTERVHQFPDTVVSHSYSNRYLRDIALDKTSDDYLAYIADSESEHILVYNLKMDKSWSVETPGTHYISLALSANREARQLYLGIKDSNELYSTSVSQLQNEGESAAAKFIGKWNRKPYRMLIDGANVLYAAFKSQTYLSKWNISEPFREQQFHEVGKLDAEYPFTFALDANGSLWMTERKETGGWTKPRHKLLKAAVCAGSYFYSTSTVSTPTRRPLDLTTLSTTHVNGETTEVVKSSPTPTSTTETVPDLADDDRESQSLNKIVILFLVCCLVLCGTFIVWLTLRMRRTQTSSRQIPTDNGAEMSVFPDDQVYDDVAPENSEPDIPENPDEPLYSEVDPDYASARNPSSEPYEVPLHLMRNANVGNPSEPVYDDVGPTEPDNIYDDVGPEPSGPSRNKKSGRKPTESVHYLKVLP